MVTLLTTILFQSLTTSTLWCVRVSGCIPLDRDWKGHHMKITFSVTRGYSFPKDAPLPSPFTRCTMTLSFILTHTHSTQTGSPLKISTPFILTRSFHLAPDQETAWAEDSHSSQ
uniref:Putative secreted protein n=1 Tax=Ixodes scapularis TaxID=6945 RepID=A0A4D5RDF0_IXOSC